MPGLVVEYSAVTYIVDMNSASRFRSAWIQGRTTYGHHRLHCCKAHSKINRKMQNSTPCKIVTHKNFNLKLCTRDYIGEATHHAVRF